MLEMVLTEMRRNANKANGENPVGAGAGHSQRQSFVVSVVVVIAAIVVIDCRDITSAVCEAGAEGSVAPS